MLTPMFGLGPHPVQAPVMSSLFSPIPCRGTGCEKIEDLRCSFDVQVGDRNLTPIVKPNPWEEEHSHCTKINIMGPLRSKTWEARPNLDLRGRSGTCSREEGYWAWRPHHCSQWLPRRRHAAAWTQIKPNCA